MRLIQYLSLWLEGRGLVSRRYCFSVTFVSIFAAKLVHLYSHIHSLPPFKFFLWGATFFVQDLILILLQRILTQEEPWSIPRVIAAVVATLLRYELGLSRFQTHRY